MIIISLVDKERWSRNERLILDTLYSNSDLREIVTYETVVAVEENGIYNCGKAFNKGFRQSCSDIIIYTTGDVVIEPLIIIASYAKLLDSGFPVFAFRVDQDEKGSWVINNDALGDFIMVKREWVEQVGGWDERLINWGALDYDFLIRVNNYLNPSFNLEQDLGRCCLGLDIKHRVKHLYHSRRSDEWYREQNKKNWAIIKEQGVWINKRQKGEGV